LGYATSTMTKHVKPEIFEKKIAISARGTMPVLHVSSALIAKQDPRKHKKRRTNGTRSVRRRCIVVFSSVSGLKVAPGMLPCSSFGWAGVVMAKKSYVRANTVCLAWAQTPMMERNLNCGPQLGAIVQALSGFGR
ncbi:hypothetical protein BO94DRAFT_468653, partial [Aspergillus sclerotioniger CBS 115572]